MDAPKNEKLKKLFAKLDSSVDRIFSGPLIKLSIFHVLLKDSVETWVVMPDFGQ